MDNDRMYENGSRWTRMDNEDDEEELTDVTLVSDDT